jgi:hypothetical protein
MIIAYAYGFSEELWQKFFRVASPEQRGMAVNFGGRMYVAPRPKERERPPARQRLEDFWEWRLRESKDPEELREFGWWAWPGIFDNNWMLSRLNTSFDWWRYRMDRNVLATQIRWR